MDDLAVIDEEVHLGAVIPDVPAKDLGIGRFKHDFFQAQSINDFGGNLGAPYFYVFGGHRRHCTW